MDFLYFIKKYKKIILIISIVCNALILSLLIGMGYLYSNKSMECEPCEEVICPKVECQNDNKISKMFVEVKGAVQKPDVYEVNEGSIVNDVIKLSGGFLSDAYTDNINLSQKLEDEMVIYVYKESEIKEEEKPKVSENNKSEVSNTNKDNASQNSKININTASKNELMKLSGIGAVKAEAIISYRNEFGKFKTIDELQKVNGIGEATFAKIKDNITI